MGHQPDGDRDGMGEARLRVRAALLSLVAGGVIMASKFVAWRLTGSSAVLSDALESVVNVLAAGFAVFALRVAARPADRDHPYSHGKVEYLSAALEGGLISFAAGLIVYHAIGEIVRGPSLRSVDVGLAVTVLAGLANLALGGWLKRQGEQLRSPTLVADGLHVLSDVWTTAGVVGGLLLVRLTGIALIDPITALLVGLLLARAGVGLLGGAVDALVDREDPALLDGLVETLNRTVVPGLVAVHRLRARRYGSGVQADAHIVAPRHWTVEQAHAVVEDLTAKLRARGLHGDMSFHVDPCQPADCPGCDLDDCRLRGSPLVARRVVTPEQARGILGR